MLEELVKRNKKYPNMVAGSSIISPFFFSSFLNIVPQLVLTGGARCSWKKWSSSLVFGFIEPRSWIGYFTTDPLWLFSILHWLQEQVIFLYHPMQWMLLVVVPVTDITSYEQNQWQRQELWFSPPFFLHGRNRILRGSCLMVTRHTYWRPKFRID